MRTMTVADRANDIDALLFSLATRIERLALDARDPSLEDAATAVMSARYYVRQHMTKADRDATA